MKCISHLRFVQEGCSFGSDLVNSFIRLDSVLFSIDRGPHRLSEFPG